MHTTPSTGENIFGLLQYVTNYICVLTRKFAPLTLRSSIPAQGLGLPQMQMSLQPHVTTAGIHPNNILPHTTPPPHDHVTFLYIPPSLPPSLHFYIEHTSIPCEDSSELMAFNPALVAWSCREKAQVEYTNTHVHTSYAHVQHSHLIYACVRVW